MEVDDASSGRTGAIGATSTQKGISHKRERSNDYGDSGFRSTLLETMLEFRVLFKREAYGIERRL